MFLLEIETHQIASITMSLIALLTTRSLETLDRQNLLTKVASLTSNATAIALMMTKSSYEAIQLLELDREIIAISLNELRADINNHSLASTCSLVTRTLDLSLLRVRDV